MPRNDKDGDGVMQEGFDHWASALAHGNTSGHADIIPNVTKQYFLPSGGRNATMLICHQILGHMGLCELLWRTLVYPVRQFSDKQHVCVLFGPDKGVVWFQEFPVCSFGLSGIAG